jgi:hypothetical protein
LQAESANRQNEVNNQVLENAEQMKNQMENLATNLSSLNGVYGGMLSAMEGKNSDSYTVMNLLILKKGR